MELLSDPVVSLEPLILAFRQERYTMVSELYVWELPLDHVQLATLVSADFFPSFSLAEEDIIINM